MKQFNMNDVRSTPKKSSALSWIVWSAVAGILYAYVIVGAI